MIFPVVMGPDTPNVYKYYWQTGATSQPHQWEGENRPSHMHADYMRGKARHYFNYYNHKDIALGAWQVDQQTKPDAAYKYITQGFPPNAGFRRKAGANTTWLTFPQDTYEIFCWAAESRSVALGTVPVNAVFTETGGNANLNAPPLQYGREPKDHSGQFRDSNAEQCDYWRMLLVDMLLRTP